jgi:hypothetical protein
MLSRIQSFLQYEDKTNKQNYEFWDCDYTMMPRNNIYYQIT